MGIAVQLILMKNSRTIYIILLNWNGWEDTVQCLESLFRSDYTNYRVIVCDNDSSDGSTDKIKSWADGNLKTEKTIHPSLLHTIEPGIQKPLAFVEYEKTEAEQGGNPEEKETRLVLIHNGSNSGFSAGNNPGIRYALKKNADLIWLLNNDTVVNPGTMSEMVNEIEIDSATGVVGSVIYFASDPIEMQTYGGGRISVLTGRDRFVFGQGKLDYITGTSFFVRREVFEKVGLLDESFFFYWEDVDLSRRVLKAGWKLSVAQNAKVFHKFSASVGSQSLKSDLYKIRSLTRYHRKHYKIWWVVPVTVHLSAMVLNRLVRRQFDRMWPILREWLKSL